MEFAELLGWALIAVVWELGTDQLPPQHGSMPCGEATLWTQSTSSGLPVLMLSVYEIGHGSLSPQT